MNPTRQLLYFGRINEILFTSDRNTHTQFYIFIYTHALLRLHLIKKKSRDVRVRPVSYIHLDVYKRQVCVCVCVCGGGARARER